MATVKKANRLLTVREEDVEHYLTRGYDQVDDSGAVVKPGKFTSKDKAAEDKIAALESENAELKAKIADLEAAVPKK